MVVIETLAGVGCSRTTPVGGVVLAMSTDGTLAIQPDTLHLAVEAPDGASYLDTTYALDAGTRLPQTLAIDSNGDPRVAVSLDLSVWADGRPLDVRHYDVRSIPTSAVQALRVVFSGRCAPWAAFDDTGNATSTCPTGTTCDPDLPGCASDTFPYDAAVADASAAGGLDGNIATEAGGAPPACAPSSRRCLDGMPQQCTSDGQWHGEGPCLPDSEYCSEGACVPVPPSCVGAGEADCASPNVPGGTFERSSLPSAVATVSAFRLDAHEVTLARFRNFVTAVVLGPGVPSAAAGKHAYLNLGAGLSVGGDAGPAFETGWDATWNASLATTLDGWTSNLTCGPSQAWQSQPSFQEALPINCVTWFEAYAFCIWDGGFLPSEAEWNDAAAAGALQRAYPWGSQAPAEDAALAVYGCYYDFASTGGLCNQLSLAPVASVPAGNGLFGQSDLAGNVAEWTLDSYGVYPSPCLDCAALDRTAPRVVRGGGFDRDAATLTSAWRGYGDPASRSVDVGFRCARQP
jgi:sulfatase modifying factor 1